MARPRADMRQKYLIPTVFSNIRIGKLGKARPWIFQTWAGLLSRSDAYGIFKWEPDRIAILVWPYNSERQDTFAEDMDLLAEGSAEDRVIEKYEVAGIPYGRFPHFEEHNAMERRGAPTLPFPAGVVPPEQKSKSKSNTEMEMELEGDLSLPRLTSVNASKPQSSVPVQPKATPTPAPSAASPTHCPHGKPYAPQLFCRECNPPAVIGGSAPKKPAVSAAPAASKTLGFDPHAINEPLAGYTLEQIQKIVRYHWDESDNSFWRDTTRSRDFFERNLPKMADAIPFAKLNPKAVGKKSFFHPKPGLKRDA